MRQESPGIASGASGRRVRIPDQRVRWVDLGSVTDPGLGGADRRRRAGRAGRSRRPSGCRPGRPSAGQRRVDLSGHLRAHPGIISSLVDRLLRSCPTLVVLATSREPLGVPGETVFRVPNLAPDEAAALFVDRATLADPGYDPREQQGDMRRICDGVDRIPLAIELAAAWVATIPPRQIADGLDDSLQLLGGGPRTALPRHQTMAALPGLEPPLLPEAEQRIFRRLAVFAGSFSSEAAAAVAGHDVDLGRAAASKPSQRPTQHPVPNEESSAETLTLLRRLVEKSFVTRTEADPVRYRLLDVTRQYAHVNSQRPTNRDRPATATSTTTRASPNAPRPASTPIRTAGGTRSASNRTRSTPRCAGRCGPAHRTGWSGAGSWPPR